MFLFLLQVFAGALFFIPNALFSPRTYRIRRGDLGRILAISVLVIYGWMYFILWGSTYTNPIDSAIIATLGPTLTLVVDLLLNRSERLNGSRVVGLGAASLGRPRKVPSYDKRYLRHYRTTLLVEGV